MEDWIVKKEGTWVLAEGFNTFLGKVMNDQAQQHASTVEYGKCVARKIRQTQNDKSARQMILWRGSQHWQVIPQWPFAVLRDQKDSCKAEDKLSLQDILLEKTYPQGWCKSCCRSSCCQGSGSIAFIVRDPYPGQFNMDPDSIKQGIAFICFFLKIDSYPVKVKTTEVSHNFVTIQNTWF